MNRSYEGVRVLVTGASAGIGLAIARKFACLGAAVGLSGRRQGLLNEIIVDIGREGGTAFALPGDATDGASVQQMVSHFAAQAGGVDVLINNVGGPSRYANFEEATDDDWKNTFELNVMSSVFFTRAVLPHLRQSPRRRILNISSISAVEPGAYNPHYTTTKAAMLNLTKYLANYLAPEKILVNAICPGTVYSESWEENIRRLSESRGVSLEKNRRHNRTARDGENPPGTNRLGK